MGQKTIRPEGSFSARAHLSPPSFAVDRLMLGRSSKLTLDVCEAQAWWGHRETKCQKTNTPSFLLHFLHLWRNTLTWSAGEGCSDIHSPICCLGSGLVPVGISERWRPEKNGGMQSTNWQLVLANKKEPERVVNCLTPVAFKSISCPLFLYFTSQKSGCNLSKCIV